MKQPSPTIAKSLHTITVLVNVAMHKHQTRMMVPARDTPRQAANTAVRDALRILGLDGKDDPYSLAATAATQVEARIVEAQKS